MSIPARIPSYLSIPSASTLLYRSTPSRVAYVHVLSKYTKMETETLRLRRRLGPISRIHAHVCRCLAPHASIACIYSLSTCSCDNSTCMPSRASLRCTFRAYRVYSRTWVFLNLSSSGSSMRAKLSGRTADDIARRAPSCRFRRAGYLRMCRLPWLGSSSRGKVLFHRL